MSRQPQLPSEPDGAEEPGHHLWAVGGAHVQRDARNGRQGHEASVSHCRGVFIARECTIKFRVFYN